MGPVATLLWVRETFRFGQVGGQAQQEMTYSAFALAGRCQKPHSAASGDVADRSLARRLGLCRPGVSTSREANLHKLDFILLTSWAFDSNLKYYETFLSIL